MLRNILTFLSLLFLAAHGLRLGSSGSVLFWLIAAGLIFTPFLWKNWVLAALLAFGAVLWTDIAMGLVQQRMSLGLPWARLAVILGVVILVSLASSLMNILRASKGDRIKTFPMAAACLITIGALVFIRHKVSLAILLPDRFFIDGGLPFIILLGVYAAVISEKLLDPLSSARWRRRIWTFFSTVFFLQLMLGLIGFEHFLMTGALHLPVPALIAAGPLYRGEGLFMILLFGATLILVGPAWCSHLCYIGAWDNLAACGKRRNTPLPGWTGTMRWLITLGVLLVAFLLGQSELPVTLAVFLAAAFGVVGVMLMLSWSRRSGIMTHCISYCPMGLMANLFGKINPWRIRIDQGCNQCGLCSLACRYNALQPLDLKRRRAGLTCSLCGDCISICPHSHLRYTFPGLGQAASRTLFIILITSLHAIFLGVARL